MWKVGDILGSSCFMLVCSGSRNMIYIIYMQYHFNDLRKLHGLKPTFFQICSKITLHPVAQLEKWMSS